MHLIVLIGPVIVYGVLIGHLIADRAAKRDAEAPSRKTSSAYHAAVESIAVVLLLTLVQSGLALAIGHLLMPALAMTGFGGTDFLTFMLDIAAIAFSPIAGISAGITYSVQRKQSRDIPRRR